MKKLQILGVSCISSLKGGGTVPEKKSSLQTQIRILLLAVFVIMLSIAVFFLHITMLEGLNKLEDRYVSEHVQRVEKEIQERLLS